MKNSNRKKLGVISGMGTRAGLLFIDKLINSIEAPTDQDFPEFILHNNSQIPDRTLSIIYGQESPENELLRSIELMNACDVDFMVSTCITSHHFLGQLSSRITKNFINPIDLVVRELVEHPYYINKVGLLATTGTITSGLFHRKFENTNIELVTLNSEDQESKFMKSVYMKGGLKSSQITPDAYSLFEEAVDRLKMQQPDVIIGGCTEVQIGLQNLDIDFHYIDVIDVLVQEIIEKMNLKVKEKLTCLI
ncbi:aspartate racemase [Dokdonia pacifica]|uniref:Aspartate racemase n=1 Tax=Dokdonia pacifica TaxID=1627892 RepID=A0A239E3K6_9FLAO|nr:amino acid racemase [Dokdonia pacifica]GGG20405.1 aspartate racemase [Dokdonia pacifica]SNS39256.1 aspartate racemase [Dokdonia pacifica]